MVENSSNKQTKKHICIALLAHVDAGKTTLSEGILYQVGKIQELGRVDNGNAYLDTHPLEKERGITIFSKQAVFAIGNTQITLLDTPGHVDFSAEMERTLQVLDYAVLLISAADGVQGHTETLWKLLQKYQVPTFIFVNKMDQPGMEKGRVLRELKKRLSDSIVDFSDTESTEFAEDLAVLDEAVMNRYLEENSIDEAVIPVMVRQRKVYPCFFGSALKMEEIDKFLFALEKYTECPAYPDEFGAKVFKIARDGQGNRLTYVKITGGVIRPRMEILDESGGWSEKVNEIRIYSGGRYEPVREASAGMVCALTGLTHTYPGEGLGGESDSGKPMLEPVLTYRILLPPDCNPAVMLQKLRLLEEEEPELHIVWNEELQEIQAQVMGNVQIEILRSLVAERFGVSVEFDTGSIVYKETITNAVEGLGHFEPLRHYAEVHLWLEPGEPGSGFQVDTDCSEDMLDKNWQRLILTHLLETEHCGVLTGAPVTDIKVTLIAGRAHEKHTEGGDFRQATYRAVRQGLMQAESVLLEPYYEFCLELPDEAVGHAMSDIERMAGSFSLEQGENGISVLTGEAPVVTMRDYAAEVHAYTKGRGRLSCTSAGYRPCHNAGEVIEKKGYNPEHDADHPCHSVFCAHGSGFTVRWDEVKDYVHIEPYREAADEEEELRNEKSSSHEEWIDVEEIDKILMQATHANRKGERGSHKGISGRKIRSLTTKPTGLSKPRKRGDSKKNYLLVDGYNIIFSWQELSELAKTDIAAARGRLMDILCNYQGFRGCRVILVFDAYRVQNHRTEAFPYHNIQVVYTREAETADRYIETFAHENSGKYNIKVATSDGLEQIIIRGEGCLLLSARDLEQEVRRAEEEMREFL